MAFVLESYPAAGGVWYIESPRIKGCGEKSELARLEKLRGREFGNRADTVIDRGGVI